MLLAVQQAPNNMVLSQFIISTASAISATVLVGMFLYLRKGWKKFRTEHTWLMTSTAGLLESTEHNSAAIVKLAEAIEVNTRDHQAVHSTSQRARAGHRPNPA